MANLRNYAKDKVSASYHRVSVPLRVAENYIENNLKFENNDFSEKYAKQLSNMINQSQFDNLKKQYDKVSPGKSMEERYTSRFHEKKTSPLINSRRNSEVGYLTA